MSKYEKELRCRLASDEPWQRVAADKLDWKDSSVVSGSSYA
jgi:hypothetical protein